MNLKNKKYDTGYVLALIMIFMVVLFTLGAAISALSFPEFFFVHRHAGRVAALQIAEAGVVEAIYRIEQLDDYNDFSGTIKAAYPPGSSIYGSYNVTITPDPHNAKDTFQIYRVRSRSVLYTNPNYSRTIEAIIESISFCRFVYFTKIETLRGYGTKIWFKMGEQLDGPVHSNDTISINWNGYSRNPPIFLDKVTTAENLYFYPRVPRGNEWSEIFVSGKSGFETEVGQIIFPPLTSLQRRVSLGGMEEPSNKGVYVPNDGTRVTGGIFIKGDVKKIKGTTDALGNQQIYITQRIGHRNRTATITMDRQNNRTIYRDYYSRTWVYNGNLNGVVYTDGNIKDFRGKFCDRLTFFTPPSKTMKIKSHVQYTEDPVSNPDFDGALGLVSGDIIVSRYAPSNLKIQAAILTGNTSGNGSFYYEGYRYYPAKGYLKILGSLCQENRGPVGMFSSWTGRLIKGYEKDYHYDTRLAYRPPPYFPCTGKFRVAFWDIID